MKLLAPFYAAIALLVVIGDRLSKTWALQKCVNRIILMKGVECELVHNKGISWGLLQANSSLASWLLSGALACIIGYMIYYAYHRYQQHFFVMGEILVIAGGLSNLADRFWYGAVIDFIYVSYGGFAFPTLFNVADMAIVGGVFGMLIFPKLIIGSPTRETP